MKTFWTITVITVFLSISLFSLLSMNHEGVHMMECLANRLNGATAPCPESDPLGFINFHSSALNKISGFIVVDGMAVFYAIAAGLLLMAGILSPSDSNRLSLDRLKSSGSKLLTMGYLLQASRLLSWFSFHENSPSFVLGGR